MQKKQRKKAEIKIVEECISVDPFATIHGNGNFLIRQTANNLSH